MKRLHNINELTERRRGLRKNQTECEKIIWKYLRDRKAGVKFRRQHSIGYYIADFFCYEKKLVIEIDGEIHNSNLNREYDKNRDLILKGLGYRVIRISNKEIETNLQKAILKIQTALSYSPLP